MYKIEVTHKGETKYISSITHGALTAVSDINHAVVFNDMSAAKNVRDEALDKAYRFTNVALVRY